SRGTRDGSASNKAARQAATGQGTPDRQLRRPLESLRSYSIHWRRVESRRCLTRLPMRSLDFSSWQAMFSTLFGLAVITLIMVGIRLLVMQTVQQRRERENRQINERLRT